MNSYTIADGEFLPYGARSQSLCGDNLGLGPDSFTWEQTQVDYARFVTDRYLKLAPAFGQVAWLCEPFSLHPENYVTAMQKFFRAVLTHNLYFIKNLRLPWLWVPYGGSMVRINDWQVYEKTRAISMIGTSKDTTPGHKLRRAIVESCGELFDVFGVEGNTKKIECLREYRFSVVIENESTPGFFTEKILDCCACGTVPIYWGAEDIGWYLDDRGIIKIDSFDRLADILTRADEDLYYKLLPHVHTNYKLARGWVCPEDYIYRTYPHLFN